MNKRKRKRKEKEKKVFSIPPPPPRLILTMVKSRVKCQAILSLLNAIEVYHLFDKTDRHLRKSRPTSP